MAFAVMNKEKIMTQEINLVAILEIKEGTWPKIADVVHQCVARSREEKGNHGYTAYFDKEDQHKIVFIECWANQQVLDEHCKSEHFQKLMHSVKPYALKPLELLNLIPVT